METKPVLKLTGTDGNVFAIIGAARKAANKAKWESSKTTKMVDEMMSGDYDNVIQTCMKYFNVD